MRFLKNLFLNLLNFDIKGQGDKPLCKNPAKNKKVGLYAKKKGFSLLETTIALTLVGIIFGVAITVFQSASVQRARQENLRFFTSEAECFLTLCRLDDANFYQNVKDVFPEVTLDDRTKFQNQTTWDGVYAIYYTSTHKITAYASEAAFTLTIYIDVGTSYTLTVVNQSSTILSVTHSVTV